MKMRFKPPEWVDEVVAEDNKWRALVKQKDELRKEVNKSQKADITHKKKAKEDAAKAKAEAKKATR